MNPDYSVLDDWDFEDLDLVLKEEEERLRKEMMMMAFKLNRNTIILFHQISKTRKTNHSVGLQKESQTDKPFPN